MIQRGTLINPFENFKEKIDNNFQKIKLILNSIFYIELKEYIFVEYSRIKVVSEPSVREVVHTKGSLINLFEKFKGKKNNFQKIKLFF